MTNNIINTTSDRHVVNQAAIRMVDAKWGKVSKGLNILYCSLHPLDTIASAIKTYMAKNEKGQKRCLSTFGCIAWQIMCSFSTLRLVHLNYVTYRALPFEKHMAINK